MLSAIMLSVIMLSVIMLSVIMLSVIMLNVIMLSVIMLGVIMLSVIVLNVFALTTNMDKLLPTGQKLTQVFNSSIGRMRDIYFLSYVAKRASLKLKIKFPPLDVAPSSQAWLKSWLWLKFSIKWFQYLFLKIL